MKMARLLALGIASVGLALASAASAGSLSAGLERQLSTLSGDTELKVLVALEEKADIAALDAELHARRAPLAERHHMVLSRLQEVAAASQPQLLRQLDELKAQGKVEAYSPHWLINAVVVRTTAAMVPALAALPGVDRVEADLVPELIQPVSVTSDGERVDREIGVAPGVEAIQAPRVWYELGIRGAGVVVANMDTGVRRTHEALSSRWRGNVAPAAECWQDAWGTSTTPSDGHGHGSHVMGTITGVASNDSIGVCPEALWIATNVIAGGTGSEFDNAVIDGLEWLADPDGNMFTMDDVPDVVQHSWGVNEGFPGYQDCDSRWWAALDNIEAAGVCNTWSAGNEGSGSTSLRSPADRATSATNSFSVGSTSANSPYNISGFSSRGPSGCGGAFATKPEISAPGENIYSVNAADNTSYTNMSGTSMAGPHIAGVVGLMRCANPDLDVTTIKQILMETAIDRGVAGEDNTYGWGFVNAYEAVLACMTGYGTLSGTVTGSGGLPLVGVSIDEQGGSRHTVSNSNGQYAFSLPAGDYTFMASFYGYATMSSPVTLGDGEDAELDFALVQLPSAIVGGVVQDANSQPIQGAVVTVQGVPLAPQITPIDGSFAFTLPVDSTITITCLGSADPLAMPLGPDSHGYRAFDPADADWNIVELTVAAEGNQLTLQGMNRAVYNWTTIDPDEGGPGTAFTFTHNDQTFPASLPFTFRYYGQDYTECSVNSNGWVALGTSTSVSWDNGPIPDVNAADPAAMLAVMWEDYSPEVAASGNVSTWHDTANRRFVVEYNHIRQFNPATAFESFQIILLDPEAHPTVTGDGAILFQYEELTDFASTTIGIESPDQTVGLQYMRSTSGTGVVYSAGCQPLATGLAVLYSTGMLPSTLMPPVQDLEITMLPDLRPRLTWSPVNGAISYRIEGTNSNGAWQSLGNTAGTSWTGTHQLGTSLFRVVAIGPDLMN